MKFFQGPEIHFCLLAFDVANHVGGIFLRKVKHDSPVESDREHSLHDTDIVWTEFFRKFQLPVLHMNRFNLIHVQLIKIREMLFNSGAAIQIGVFLHLRLILGQAGILNEGLKGNSCYFRGELFLGSQKQFGIYFFCPDFTP